MTHEHATPIFGCEGCIKADRGAWEHQQYKKYHDLWLQGKTKKHFCPRHPTITMRPYCYHEHEGRLKAVLTCDKLTEDGEFVCEDKDMYVDIESL